MWNSIYLQDVTQHLVLLRSGEDKDQELLNLFKQRFDRGDLVLVFVARKNTCDFVANMLNRSVKESFIMKYSFILMKDWCESQPHAQWQESGLQREDFGSF